MEHGPTKLTKVTKVTKDETQAAPPEAPKSEQKAAARMTESFEGQPGAKAGKAGPITPEAPEPSRLAIAFDPADFVPRAQHAPIETVANDDLTPRDMLTFISAAVNHWGLVGHNTNSFNELLDHGVSKIITEMFAIDRRLRNERPQDKNILSHRIEITFSQVNIGRPVYATYITGSPVDLYPERARISGAPYSAPITLAAEVRLTATYANGHEEVKVAEVPSFQAASFPIMVGSNRCHTYKVTRAGLKEMHEDPTDPGGYFIAKNQKYAVELLENTRFNTLHVHLRMVANERVRGEFISQPGGPFDNSSQIIVRFMENGALTIEINSTKLAKAKIPFYLLYRVFGMTADRDIVETVVFDLEAAGSDPTTDRMLQALDAALHKADSRFEALADELNRERIIEVLAAELARFLTNPAAYLTTEHMVQYLNSELLRILDQMILPHMGTAPAARPAKLRYLGRIIHKIFLVDMGVLPPTDRDTFAKKRCHGPGISLNKALKTQFNNTMIGPLIAAFKRELKNNPFQSITPKTMVDTFRNAAATNELNRGMEQAITAGNKVITMGRRPVTNRVSTQLIEQKNWLHALSTLRTITTHNANSASKATERADRMRRVHPSFPPSICVAQSADTGEFVGMRKQLGITASVTTAGDAAALKQRLAADPEIIPLDRITDAQAAREALAPVNVNGVWVGYCASAHRLVERYRALRREGRVVEASTTIYWDPVLDEVEFWLDVGRVIHPALIVYSNLAEYDEACFAVHRGEPGAQKVKFVQNVRFTKRHAQGILRGETTLEDLLAEGVAELLTPEELENCLVAPSLDELRAHRNDVTMRFTHCHVPQMIFGLAALVSPFGNHTQPARVTYETNQGRQTAGWFMLNFMYQMEKNRMFQLNVEVPLVRTIAQAFVLPNGMNTVVAYAPARGDNQEDSAVLNKASADRGLFEGAFFKYERADLERNEEFRKPDPLTTKNMKPNACYEKLVDGFVPRGSVVVKGDVLIGRVAKIVRGKNGAGAEGDATYLYTDRSIVYRGSEPAYVDVVVRPRGADNYSFGIVRLRFSRPLTVGDKLSSREGNKCLTPDHEVLTGTRGWIGIAAVTLDDTVACLGAAGQLEYHAPSQIHEYEHDGPLYRVAADGVDLCATLNHRMWARPGAATEYGFYEAAALVGKRARYLRAAANLLPDVETKVCARAATGPPRKGEQALRLPMDAWLRLLGAFIRGGVVLNHYEVGLRCKNEKQRRAADAIAQDLGSGVLHYYCKEIAMHVIASQRLCSELAELGASCGRLPVHVWQLSARQAGLLLAALVANERLQDARLEVQSADLADDIQRLALHAGLSADVRRAGGKARMARPFEVHVSDRGCPAVNRPGRPRSDRLVAYKGRIHCLTVPGGIFYVRRNGKPVWTGNSIVAQLLPQSDMPYIAASGITPDLIINMHSFPSRMTIGQLYETSLAKTCARKCAIADGTAFLPISYDDIGAELQRLGFRYNGRERMYDARGRYLDVALFVGFTYEQRLLKFVLDDEYAVAGTGPTDATTGQPLGGKNVGGGLRLGEMENWALLSHGSTMTQLEKLTEDSDGRTAYVCRGCGDAAICNPHDEVYRCLNCGEYADIAAVETRKSAIVFREELDAANVKMRMGLRPREFERRLPPSSS